MSKRILRYSLAALIPMLAEVAVSAGADSVAPEAVSVPNSVASRPRAQSARSLAFDELGRAYVDQELLVMFQPGAAVAERSAVLEKCGAALVRRYDYVGVDHVRVRASHGTLEARAALRAEPAVLHADLNYVDTALAEVVEPNDPLYPLQWHWNNRGQVVRWGGWRHTDNVNNDNRFEDGEAIYDDVDGDGVVSGADTLLFGPAQGGGAALKAFNADERLLDFRDTPEPVDGVYRDTVAPPERINVGDTRITPLPGLGLAAGVVAAADVDCGLGTAAFPAGETVPGTIDADVDAPQSWAHHTDCSGIIVGVLDSGADMAHPDLAANLIPGRGFVARERYHDRNGNEEYNDGEDIYIDVDNNKSVSTIAGGDAVDDTHLSGAGNAARGDSLSDFIDSLSLRREKHDETVRANREYDPGEGIYDDRDDSNTVTADDVRILPPGGLPAGPVAAGDADAVAARPLRRFNQRWIEKYHDANGDGDRDANEAIYSDDDRSNDVSPGDFRLTRIAGPPALAVGRVELGDGDLRRPLTRFAANERVSAVEPVAGVDHVYVEGGDNSGIYRDIDGNRRVSRGDVRVTPVERPGGAGTYAAGSVVRVNPPDAVTDDDVNVELMELGQEQHSNPNGNGFYESNEWVIRDMDFDEKIGAGDRRLTATGGGAADSIVAANDPDAGVALQSFYNIAAVNILHTDPNGNGLYDAGEGIYNDRDLSGTVTAGDFRITPRAGAAADEVAEQDVAAGDTDAVAALALAPFGPRETDDVTDIDGHGTYCAGMIGAVGNNGVGITGVCWQARILPLKIGDGSYAHDAQIAALNYCIARRAMGGAANDIRILNASYGGRGFSATAKAAYAAAGAAGILFTLAAGNDGVSNEADGAPAEPVYRDVGGPGVVSAGDVRLSGYGHPWQGLGPGSVVANGDPDTQVGNPPAALTLRAFLPFERHVDNAGGTANRYDAFERCYRDLDGSGTVTTGDIRLALIGAGANQLGPGTVNAGDPDQAAATALVAFAADERYSDIDGDGLFLGNAPDFPTSYDLPEFISVGASTNKDTPAGFSNFGTVSVDLMAPGELVLSTRTGGGYGWINGTSFAAPLVAGVLAHIWTDGNLTQSKESIVARLLADENGALLGQGVPQQHGIDHRYGLRGTVRAGAPLHDGRARMGAGDDLGDARDPNYPTKSVNWGARHEDIGEEWLGRDPALPPEWVYDLPLNPPPPSRVSPEFDAYDALGNPWPPDPDGVPNLVDQDAHDQGVMLIGPFIFSGPAAARVANLRVFVNTANNDVVDFDGGRYALATPPDPFGGSFHSAGDGVHRELDDKHVWVNGWFDWNRDGDFEDADEHVVQLACNPRAWSAPAIPGQPYPTRGGVYHLPFEMPQAPAGVMPGPTWCRFRLDYGENCGENVGIPPPNAAGPSPGGLVQFWNDPGGLPQTDPFYPRHESYPAGPAPAVPVAPINWRSRGLARYGEVEDYLINIGRYTPVGPIKYVDQNAVGANDGSSWQDAFTDLQTALLTALATNGEVAEIWVASGVYEPAGINGDRDTCFNLVNGVALYGGFAGNEAQRDQRNPAANPTILSGDLNRNDGPNFANYGENSRHVVCVINCNADTILDGFIICAGNADGAQQPASVGGDLLVVGGTPQIRNCRIILGSAAYGGGGVFVAGGSLPTFARCEISDNRTTGGCGNCGGAGFYAEGENSPYLVNCDIARNSATAGSGGGLFIRAGGAGIVANCHIHDNAAGYGGGVCIALDSDSVVLGNCTIRANQATHYGGGFLIYRCDPLIANSISWGNTAPPNFGPEFAVNCPAAPHITFCDVAGGQAAIYRLNAGLCNINYGIGNIDQNPLFDAQGRILPGSPCVDVGSNNLIPGDMADLDGDANRVEPLPLDLDEQTRVHNNVVDIGATEVQNNANPFGACCVGQNCTITRQADCGGDWRGAGTNCDGPEACPAAPCDGELLGDSNGDGAVNNFDIDAFVLAISNPPAYLVQFCGGDPDCFVCRNDIDSSGLVNNFDIDPFVACLNNLPLPGQGCP